jgi:hypothetical protein
MLSLVPEEIFELIKPENVSLFLTSKSFYKNVDVFYRSYTVNIMINPLIKLTNSFIVDNIVKVKLSAHNLGYYNSVYKLVHAYEIPDGKFVNLTHLSFNDSFNSCVDALNNLYNIESLVFGRDFNQLVDNFPKKLKSLTFGMSFCQPVDNLPETLTSLTFGSSFNMSVDNLPQNLKWLTFGFCFNQQVDVLPKNLK